MDRSHELTIKQIFSSAWEDGEETAPGPADILVYLSNGEKYIASFFPYDHIETLRQAHRQSGDFLHGRFFWAKHLVLAEDSRRETVKQIVQYLLEEGEFREVFAKI